MLIRFTRADACVPLIRPHASALLDGSMLHRTRPLYFALWNINVDRARNANLPKFRARAVSYGITTNPRALNPFDYRLPKECSISMLLPGTNDLLNDPNNPLLSQSFRTVSADGI